MALVSESGLLVSEFEFLFPNQRGLLGLSVSESGILVSGSGGLVSESGVTLD